MNVANDKVITLKLPRRTHLVSYYVGGLPFLLVIAGIAVWGWVDIVQQAQDSEPGDWTLALAIGLLVVALTTALIGYLVVVTLSWLAQDLFPRAIHFDAGKRVVSITNVPGFTRRFRFDEIQSLEIVRMPASGGWWLYLCLQVTGRIRLWRLAEIRANPNWIDEAVQRRFIPICDKIREVVDVPVVEESRVSIWRRFLITGM